MNTLTQTENRPAASAENYRRTSYLAPLANIRESKDGYLLEVEMPGVNKEGLELTFENNELTIHGKRQPRTIQGELVYGESRPLDYRRVFELDPSINAAGITAKVEQGILTLTLPKAESVKPRKIAVTE